MPDLYHAQIDWDDNGQPRSRSHGDPYFSRASGIGETQHVFLDGNRLAERLTALPEGASLHIAETGFGTGLNFLCAWRQFEALAPASARLHFISVEKHPLSLEDLRRALQLWPELTPWSEHLLEQYRAVHSGFQRFVFAAGRVFLTLLIGDVLELLPELDGRIDAWFLDGFSPAKNPDMWSDELFQQMAQLSHPGTSLATFTSAGFVRRGLQAAGFVLQRVKGFSHKREMLVGQFSGTPLGKLKPWFARPNPPQGARQALVIGGGMAGCATAASLAARGWQVTLIERHPALAMEASGNPQGVLYLKLSAHRTPLTELILSGFGYTRRLLQRLPMGEDWSACGVLQLALDAREQERQRQLTESFPSSLLQALTQPAAEQLAGVALPAGGLFFPEAGWLHPPALCRRLAEHPNIRLITGQAVQLRRDAHGWGAWHADTCLAQAPVAVLATATAVREFSAAQGLPLKSIRGQITQLTATPQSAALRTVLCAAGYLAPPRQASHTLGASFNFHDLHSELRLEEHLSNLQLLEELSPELGQRLGVAQLDPQQLQGRAALRCSATDYLPLVGPLADQTAFSAAYQILGKDARQRPDIPCPWLEGLYLNTAHGSRGLITAPLSGELLAAWLDNEPLPLARSLAEACHPNRFWLRQLVRGTSG